MKRKVVAEVVDEVRDNNMSKKNKNLGGKANPPTHSNQQQTISQLQLLNLGYYLGDEHEGPNGNKRYRLSEVIDEDNKPANFCLLREISERNWMVIPCSYSHLCSYRP